MTAVSPNGAHQTSRDITVRRNYSTSIYQDNLKANCAFFVVYLYIVLYCVYVIVYMSDQITLNYVVCIYFASPGASHLLNCVIR